MQDDKILAVSNGKTHTKRKITESQNKMLASIASIVNLDTNFGGGIFPNHPKALDDQNKREMGRLVAILSVRHPRDINQLKKN